jgi:hypothetical protein
VASSGVTFVLHNPQVQSATERATWQRAVWGGVRVSPKATLVGSVVPINSGNGRRRLGSRTFGGAHVERVGERAVGVGPSTTFDLHDKSVNVNVNVNCCARNELVSVCDTHLQWATRAA